MGKPFDVSVMKGQVEAAMEALLRAADERVRWKLPADLNVDQPKEIAPQLYSFLPGVYRSSDSSTNVEGSSTSLAGTMDTGAIMLLLHGDNSFEYTWHMQRPAPRAMEYLVEAHGVWHKPVLNRSRRGDEDQRVFLATKRIRFQRLSNYDAATNSWKLTLRTLTRHGSEWAPVGESERGIPPINMVFTCGDDGVLESAGAVVPGQVLSNSPACRVLAGLTKKVGNKLGGPLDVMTEKWLPSKHSRLVLAPTEQRLVKNFNPFYFLAEVLRGGKPKEDEPNATDSVPISA